jgi:hypothetical protein
MGNLLFSTLYGTYAVTLNELQNVLKVSAQAEQSGAENKISVESTALDDNVQQSKETQKAYLAYSQEVD